MLIPEFVTCWQHENGFTIFSQLSLLIILVTRLTVAFLGNRVGDLDPKMETNACGSP